MVEERQQHTSRDSMSLTHTPTCVLHLPYLRLSPPSAALLARLKRWPIGGCTRHPQASASQCYAIARRSEIGSQNLRTPLRRPPTSDLRPLIPPLPLPFKIQNPKFKIPLPLPLHLPLPLPFKIQNPKSKIPLPLPFKIKHPKFKIPLPLPPSRSSPRSSPSRCRRSTAPPAPSHASTAMTT